MIIKYFKIDVSLKEINSYLKKELKLYCFRDFLELMINELTELYELYNYSEGFGENWVFSVAEGADVIKIEIPDNSFTKFKSHDAAVRKFLDLLKEEGIYEGSLDGTNSTDKMGYDWNYKILDGIESLYLIRKENRS